MIDPSKPTGSPAAGGFVNPPGTGLMGMRIFLVSLGILFAASIGGYLAVRARAEAWPPPDLPRLPAGLWVSTVIILLGSGSVQWALAGVRRNKPGVLLGALLVTMLLGLVFLVSQGANWAWLISINARASTGMYMFTFYLLTGLHGLHVLGGIGLLATVTAKAFGGRYSAHYHPGVKYAQMYWHFLGAVWLVMFVLMFLV